jgi:hypothetical protein
MESFWTYDPANLFKTLNTSVNGLSDREAYLRLQQQRSTLRIQKPWLKDFLLLLSQYKILYCCLFLL